MKRIVLSAAFLALFAAVCGTAGHAQIVPPSVEKKILIDLKKQPECKGQSVQFVIENARLSAGKIGFTGVCTRNVGVAVLYKKTSHGLNELLRAKVTKPIVEFKPTENINKGYYDISLVTEIAPGGHFCVAIYRWDGLKYVLHSKRCTEE